MTNKRSTPGAGKAHEGWNASFDFEDHTKIECALQLAARGFNVFPVRENSKMPLIEQWPSRATTDPKQIERWWDEWPEANIGICTTDFKGRHLVVVDLDVKDGKDGVALFYDKFPVEDFPENTFTVETPSGGQHLYYLSEGRYRSGTHVLAINIDIRATGGFVVAPGSTIDDKPYKVIDASPMKTLPPGGAARLKPVKAKAEIVSLASVHEGDPRRVERAREYLATAAPAIQGQGGDNHTVAVANQLGDLGISRETALSLMGGEWNERCEPPWELSDLKVKVFSAYKSRENPIGCRTGAYQFSDVSAFVSNRTAPEPIVKTDGIRLLTISDLLNKPAPRFLVRNMLPEFGVAILAGQSRHMKSFLALLLGMSIATGRKVGACNVIQKPAVYMLNEGAAGFGARVRAWLQFNDIDHVPNFRVIEQTPNLMNSDTADAFIAAINEHQFHPGIIVIDTFSKATIGGEDNSTKDMAEALSNAERIGRHFNCLVLLIDHLGKDPKKGIRGAYTKLANADAVGLVVKTGNTVSLYIDKMKDGPDGQTFYFDIKHVETPGEQDTTPALSAQSMDTTPKQADFIRNRLEAKGELTREALRAEFLEMYPGRVKSFNETLRRLEKYKKIIQENGTYVLAGT